MNAAYREVLGKTLPARATVEAGLVSPDGAGRDHDDAAEKPSRKGQAAGRRQPALRGRLCASFFAPPA